MVATFFHQEDLAKVIEELFTDAVEENNVEDEEIMFTETEEGS